MKSTIDVAARARLGTVLSVLALGALVLPLPVGAVVGHTLETFSDASRGGLEPAVLVDTGAAAWVVHAGDEYPVYQAGAGLYPSETAASFARDGDRDRSRDGGGWLEHGGLGEQYGDHDDGHHCDDGCVGTSAVPEPKRAALTVVGLLAVVLLVKRQGRARRPLAAP